MNGNWRQSPYFTALVVVVIIIITIIIVASFFFRSKSILTEADIFGLRIEESVGMVAAEEAVRILGSQGGSLALILPNEGAPASDAATLLGKYGSHQRSKVGPLASGAKTSLGSVNEAHLQGFQKALKKLPAFRLAGHFLTGDLDPETRVYNLGQPSLAVFQAAREKFPQAQLLVSFIGLPQFQPVEETQWLQSSPPKIIAVQHDPTQPEVLKRLFQISLVQSVITFKQGVSFPKKKPTDLRKIFELFCEVQRPA